MGAIIGQFALDGSALDSRRFHAALTRDVPRGEGFRVLQDSPDGCMAVRDGCASLRTTGLPLVALDGVLHDTMNLRERLGAGKQANYADLVARAWAKWAQGAPGDFFGDYAAALHDAQSGTVTLLRDHIGTRPLFWHWANACLSVATFMPDLLALLSRRPDHDSGAVAAYLRFPPVIGPHTLFDGIRSVEPGHMIVCDRSGPCVLRWWKPEDARDVRFKRPQEYAEACRDLVERAVIDRLPSRDVDVGAHLSGGIDSTVVAVIAQQALADRGSRLKSVYSWSPTLGAKSPRTGPDDERDRILEICAATGLSARFGGLSGQDMRAFLSRPMELEGLADLVDETVILEHAGQDGIQVMLSGWGGDEAFSAHAQGVPAWMLVRGRLGRLVSLARARAGLRHPHRMAKFLLTDAVVPLLPDPLFARFGPFADLYGKGCYISEGLAARAPVDGLAPVPRLTADPHKDMCALFDLHHIGERMATWAAWGAPRGIEYRYPLVDRRLIDFILGVPPDILWGDASPRYLARITLRGRLKARLSKSDPANERKRLDAMRGCWRILQDEAAAGEFDASCQWLDMVALRADLMRGPSGDDFADPQAFIRIMSAVRIWHMSQR